MSNLKLAANAIAVSFYHATPPILWPIHGFGGRYHWGHLQIVFQKQEIEVQAPFWATLGDFSYPESDAVTVTDFYGEEEEERYKEISLDLTSTGQARKEGEVWQLLSDIH